MTKDKLSESEIKLLENMANNVRLMPSDVRNAIKHALKIVRSETKTEDDPKPTKYPIGTKVHTIYGDGVVDKTIEGDVAVRLYGGGLCGIGSISGVQCENDDDWQSYRIELAKAVAPAMIGSNYQSTMAFDVESFNDDVVRIVDGIVERLKNGEV